MAAALHTSLTLPNLVAAVLTLPLRAHRWPVGDTRKGPVDTVNRYVVVTALTHHLSDFKRPLIGYGARLGVRLRGTGV